MRADAEKNYRLLLTVARAAIAEQGADASLRDIARKAGVGLATLYRHFPTREALLEALLRTTLDELTLRAADLQTSASPGKALYAWLGEAVAFVQGYNGVVSLMATALADDHSALHAACSNLRSAGGRLLERAQAKGEAREDLDGVDLFALIGALGWLGGQAVFAPRVDHLVDFIAQAILTEAKQTRCDSA